MVEVNETLTQKVAQLARLELTDQELKTFTHQLGDILKYVELLQEVDVSKVEPLSQAVELQSAFREDVVNEFPMDAEGKPKTLGPAPEVMYDGYKVPPIL